MAQTEYSTIDDQAVEDEGAFQQAVKPELEILTQAARQALDFYVERAHIHVDDLTLDRSEAYHVLLLHDEFKMPMPEVAFTMGRSINAVAELVDQARVTFRKRLGNESAIAETDDPAPPAGSDQ